MIRLPWRSSGRPQPLETSAAQSASSEVRGERDAAIGAGARSLQSHMSSLLAAGLMTCVGAAMLAWYYGEVLSRPAAHRRAHMTLEAAPGGGMILPPFGPDTAPVRARAAPAAAGASLMAAVPRSQAAAVQSAAALQAASLLGPPLARAPQEPPPAYGAPAQLSPRQRALARRLSGGVFVRAPNEILPGGREEVGAPASGATGATGGPLQRLLRPSVFAATQAQLLPTRHLLLPKGASIDCTLETAIDSTLPGMTTCITATDTFSADGTVVLLERGTQLIGETRGEVRQGQARVFVVWTEARTPEGVVVRLDSPGTDALGRSGLAGKVNRHFWERFGAAALVSTLDGAVQSEVESSSRGGTLILNPTGSEDVLTGILRSTVDIPPTIRIRNGARIQVLVARDVDFRSVYELEPR
ncbi:MAG TPA: type IV secretion system protein VirB10 [Steroidobacteraceae bacterium]|nr:type IV secretion system protein VirB10 [Steroidobacteraceae bacterium]